MRNSIKNGSYRGMLRDRVPLLVNMALKWCRVKNEWVEHCYKSFIWHFVENKDRKHATRLCLGISENKREFDFDKTIDWCNLTEDEKKKWKTVSEWVKWFTANMYIIRERYDLLTSRGANEFEIQKEFISRYLYTLLPNESDSDEVKEKKYKYVNNLSLYLIECSKELISRY